jgi:hypothetical protein
MRSRFWFHTVGVSVTAAVLFAVVIALLTATAVLAFSQKESPDAQPLQTVAGMLTDSRCGARHPSTSKMSVSQCARFCIKQGASWALVDGDAVYMLKGDSPAFDRMAGQRVKLTGLIEGNSIQVQSIEPISP